jgi:hypothetical protein
MHAKGLPKWMLFKSPADALNKAQQAKIVQPLPPQPYLLESNCRARGMGRGGGGVLRRRGAAR